MVNWLQKANTVSKDVGIDIQSVNMPEVNITTVTHFKISPHISTSESVI